MDQNPIEETYGMPLQITVIQLLNDFKATPPEKELTVFFLAEKIAEKHETLKPLLADKRKRKLFHIRVRKCLQALIKTNKLSSQIQKSSTKTNYNTYKILF
jgi:hypothetical protein